MKALLSTFAIALFSTAAIAASHVDFKKVDTDGDGKISMEEMKAAMPETDDEKFKMVDTDGDGSVSEEELAAMK